MTSDDVRTGGGALAAVRASDFARELREPRGAARGTLALVLGLSIIGTWTNLVGYGGAFFNAGDASKTAYQLCSFAMAVCFCIAPRAVERSERVARVAVPLLMALATAARALAPYQTLLDPAVVDTVTCCILGPCYAGFVLTCYASLAQRAPMSTVIAAIAGAQVAEQLGAALLNAALPDMWVVAACILLPLAAGGCLAAGSACRTRPAVRIAYTDAAEKYQLVLIGAISLASIAMSRVSSVGIWGEERSDYAQGGLLVTLVACVLLAVYVRLFLAPFVGQPLNIRYQPAFLVLVVGCLGLLMLPSEGFALGIAGTAVDHSLEFFAHVTMWVVAADAVQRLRFHPYRTVGFVLVLGPLLSAVWTPGSDEATVRATLVILLAVVLAIAAVPFLANYLRQRSLVSPEAASGGVVLRGDPNASAEVLRESLRARLEVLAAERGLTERELDVLELLARGKTRALIQESLFISESTVKTHIRHIYAKFGVSSAAELMAVVFEG